MPENIKTHKKPKQFKCTECGQRYTSYNLLVRHVESVHKDVIPEGKSVHQFIFDRRNKINSPKLCVICKKNPVTFNLNTLKYNRFCSVECRKKAGEIAERNLKKKTGMGRKERMSNPDTQKALLANRGTSGTYTFRDGKTTISYASSYELNFLKFYDLVFQGDPLDLIECPYTFDYIYEGKRHTYIPDYCCNLGGKGGILIIEIKDGAKANQTNQAIIEGTFAKEIYKDEAILRSGMYNFIKIRDDEYDNFVQVMNILKERNASDEKFDILFIDPER
jgi:hypothetical protein